ncbi:hypothetical protein D9611_013779 [Ephemerocybe angulata]|uniref:Uncharacterized protein n=1 Tax=Ephemerocybe angulata TaxID=980116 RepID=A0A8H5C5U2_9AGAR|nr:hypothetical protein D9611_013779 [Tulosesus angulatus]
MALSFIGKPISLISHSDVRYRGILAGIDPQASTIQLSNVYSMGTESRRPANQYIPPMADPYQYIIFKASEVKDLSVDEPVAATRNVHDDPAVMVSAPIAPTPPANTFVQQANAPQYTSRPPPQQPQAAPAPPQQNASPMPPQADNAAQSATGSRSQSAQQNRRQNPVHTAAASLETVERALGDLRVSNGAGQVGPQGGRGGRRGPGGGGHHGAGAPREQIPITVPKTDFDFASSNAKFDKSALAPVASPAGADASGGEQEENGEESQNGTPAAEKKPAAYNPQASFFDSLSSNAAPDVNANNNNSNNNIRGGLMGPRGGRGRGGRSRRDEEREKNVATFGEPGGVGLMGPGAYVGGWGGYGRRGGRPRRGGGRGGGHGSNQNQTVQARG